LARKRKRKQDEAAETESGFADEAARPQERERLTPVEIQQRVFRLAFRGYNERDVDEFLDRVTEDLAAIHEENKRLREQLAEGGGAPGGLEEAQRQAETIVRQAREHAARLVEQAESQTVSPAAGAAGQLPASFLLQERGFLQQMAGLIQDHARRLKDEARRARASGEGGPAGEPAEAVAPPAEAASPPPPSPSPPPPAESGGPIAGAAAAAAMSEAPGPEEATAPWSPVEAEPEEPPTVSDEPTRDEADPLLSAWESAFTREEGEQGRPNEEAALYPVDSGSRDQEEGEPSLRELFWGEE
jgi:DivIVA domain-containing protein